MRYRRRQYGFTLIEMMIAMTILAFIALGVYSNTTQTYKLRESVEQEGDFYNAIRVTLDLLGRDISQMYSPSVAALPGETSKSQNTTQPDNSGSFGDQPPAEPTDFWDSPINQFGVRPSRFQGDAGKIMFVTNGHTRLFRDAPESDFETIVYALEDDSDTANARRTTLVKRANTAAFEMVEDTKDTELRYVLLTGVKKLEFSFLDGEKDQWHPRWDTASQEHRGVFPAVIQITLEVQYPNSEATFTVVQRYKPEMMVSEI